MKGVVVAAMLCLSLAAPRFAAAVDVWDAPGGHTDDFSGTDNELANGSLQIHDLEAAGGIADQDWYLIGQQPFSSYEVLVDGLTEEVASIPATTIIDAIQVDLVDGGGTVINSGYAMSSIGAARSLRFRNTTATEITDQYVRIMTGSDGCTTFCSANAQYRVQFYETTMMIPRFNNSATQITIMIVQNSSSASVDATARFFNTAGTLLASQGMSIAAHGAAVINTSTIAGLLGTSGVITIDHDGRYGALAGKGVALEPGTGFTFDTMMTPKFQ
jgi:hypothetical protein